jgi:hypothetical protein
LPESKTPRQAESGYDQQQESTNAPRPVSSPQLPNVLLGTGDQRSPSLGVNLTPVFDVSVIRPWHFSFLENSSF